ncbi:DUF7108 domain-containing protein [Haloprofundus halobius]|uniref:DUF7108 domain-containing protein n=1 Tax=Haloprofundus halobius TaxID=2876194 RepID=UPI001CCCE07D|nr:rnhA operon protein [Haloprofundus halobius]
MAELPEDVQTTAERLTRLARDAVDPNEAEAYRERRDASLADHGYTARYREADDTLVLYPAEWIDDDGTVALDRIDDTDRAVERSLSGTGKEDEWEAVEKHNASLVAAVESSSGSDHAANARAFADFMSNHYVRRVETAGVPEIREFLTEYYPRNSWPTEAQKTAVRESLERLFEQAGEELPDVTRTTR